MPLFPDSDATVYADQFRDPARTAASSQLYRSYWRLAHAILLRRAFEGQRLEAPTQVLFGVNDFYIPVAVLEEIEAHGADPTLDVVEGCSHWMPEERPDRIRDAVPAAAGRYPIALPASSMRSRRRAPRRLAGTCAAATRARKVPPRPDPPLWRRVSQSLRNSPTWLGGIR